MNDRDFVAAFEACTLPNGDFHHRDHVRLAWIYLNELPPAAALARFTKSLKRFAQAQSADGLYHETITWAYLLLIHERMARRVSGEAADTFEGFAAAHPDLLTWKPSILESYYQAETLGSELARRVFVMPDRGSADTAMALPPREGLARGERAIAEGRTVTHAQAKQRLARWLK